MSFETMVKIAELQKRVDDDAARVKELESRVAALEARRGPGRPAKDQKD